MDNETEERFAALETKAAYMEDYIDQLQQVSVAQTKQVDILRSMLQSLCDKVASLSPDVPSTKPPHY